MPVETAPPDEDRHLDEKRRCDNELYRTSRAFRAHVADPELPMVGQHGRLDAVTDFIGFGAGQDDATAFRCSLACLDVDPG